LKKPQWITIAIAVLLTAGIYFFGRTVPVKKAISTQENAGKDNHSHEVQPAITIDTILTFSRQQLDPSRPASLAKLENKLKAAGDNKEDKTHALHQLSRFWGDSARVFEPFAWYLAEAARLENSEKNLTFAARLFLDNLQQDEMLERRQWKALQAKDLFERSLKINPGNDSAKVGIGACYLFGNISEAPMEGIMKIREVVEKDSTNTYAQLMLAKGSLLSGQYDKAVVRLESVNRMKPGDLESTLMLADVYERMKQNKKAVEWYQKATGLTNQKELKTAIQQRIEELKK
jgi:tetratricopeptide (TPR) repeat protein